MSENIPNDCVTIVALSTVRLRNRAEPKGYSRAMRTWLPVLSVFTLVSVGGDVGEHGGDGRIRRTPPSQPEFQLTHDTERHQYTGWSPGLEGRAHGSRAQAVSRVEALSGSVFENVKSEYAAIRADILVCVILVCGDFALFLAAKTGACSQALCRTLHFSLQLKQALAAKLSAELRNAVALFRSTHRLSIVFRSRAARMSTCSHRSM